MTSIIERQSINEFSYRSLKYLQSEAALKSNFDVDISIILFGNVIELINSNQVAWRYKN